LFNSIQLDGLKPVAYTILRNGISPIHIACVSVAAGAGLTGRSRSRLGFPEDEEETKSEPRA